MNIIKGKKFVYFDVDDTLVLWHQEGEDLVAFSNPDDASDVWMLKPNWPIIAKLKQHKRDGDTVIVWSQGGWDWAQEAVSVLRLESYVDAVMTKPHMFYDDIPAERFMKDWVKV